MARCAAHGTMPYRILTLPCSTSTSTYSLTYSTTDLLYLYLRSLNSLYPPH